MVPVFMALVLTTIFTSISLVSRYFKIKGKMDSLQLMADSLIVKGILMIILILCLPMPYSWDLFFKIVGLSFLGAAALFLLNEAIVHGKAGPSQALVEIQSIAILFLEITVMGQVPNNM